MSERKEDYVKLENVSKIYGSKEVKIVAVDEISFQIAEGEFVVIVATQRRRKNYSSEYSGRNG